MKKYRKRPLEIEAIQWLGKNFDEINEFTNGEFEKFGNFGNFDYALILWRNKLDGMMKVYPFDWIIKGINGEFYPCNEDVFKKTYEEVKE